MPRERRRKCHHCGQLYHPDPRNRWRQRYCAAPACRQATKAASQQRWRTSAKGRDYFRGTANRLRVRTWRQNHPGYWRNRRRSKNGALQDHCAAQVLVPPEDTSTLKPRALQDLLVLQGLALTGLMAQLAGSALQENIALTTRRLIGLGQEVLGARKIRCGGYFWEHGLTETDAPTACDRRAGISVGGAALGIGDGRWEPAFATPRSPSALVSGGPHDSKPP
jgi:hypothetical protein